MSLIFFDRNGDGSQKLLDSKIDPLEMQRSMKLEEHVSVYEDFLTSGAAGDGTYGYQGDYLGGRQLTAPKAMIDGLTGAQRAERVRLRMQSGEPPLLLSMDPKTGIKIFAEEDKEAFEAGYICERCVQYQAVPNAPKCNWLFNPTDGCGQQNY